MIVKKRTIIYALFLFIVINLALLLTLYITRRLKKEVGSRKIFEEKLKESEEYYRSLFENTGTATMILGKDFYIKRCNQNFAELCGYPCSEVENKKKWTEFVVPEDLKRMREYASHRGKNKFSAPASYDFIFLRGNGERRNVHVYVEPIGNTNDRVASIIDMTENVKTQELLIQTEKMLSVGGLAAGMAHEINNPLAGILQGAQNIQRRISPEVEANITLAREQGCSIEQIHSYLEKRGLLRMLQGIQSSGERAALIVKNMLDFTRHNEAGRTGCNLNELLDEIIDIISCDYDLRKKYDFKHTKIVKEYQENITQIPCYRIEIEQVFLNLIKNAAYAMYETSKIRPPVLILRTKEDRNYVSIEIEDNGPGMSKDVKKDVFSNHFSRQNHQDLVQGLDFLCLFL